MTHHAFNTVEPLLRRFFANIYKNLGNNDPIYLVRVRGLERKSHENLQLTDYCRLMTENAEGYRDRDAEHCKLFGVYKLDKNVIGKISFIKSLRNKYFHGKGNEYFDSKEQLGDMIIIQGAVHSLSNLFEQKNEADESLKLELGMLVNELIVQVALTTDPNLDTDGEEKILSQADRDFFLETIRDALQHSAAASNQQNEVSSELDMSVASVAGQYQLLKQLDKKLGPLKSLKGQLNSIEMSLTSRLTKLDFVVTNIQESLDRNFLLELESESSQRDAIDLEAELDQDEFEDDADVADRLDKISYGLSKMLVKLEDFTKPRLTVWQARDELISLRKRIWVETKGGPSSDGLLRRSMIDEFLDYLPYSEEEAQEELGILLETVSEDQIPYLPEVCSILRRVQAEL